MNMNLTKFMIVFCITLPFMSLFVALLEDLGYDRFWHWVFRLTGGAVFTMICLFFSLPKESKK